MDSAAVEELLESAERKANAKDAAKKHRDSSPTTYESIRDGGPSNRDYDDARRKEKERDFDRDRYSADREGSDRRRSGRSRDVDQDAEMKDGSDRGSANGSVRSRRRSKSPEADRRPNRPSRDRDHLDRGGDYYTGGGRRPPVDDDYYRPGRHGGGGRDPRDRERSRSPRRDRDPRRDRRRSPERSRKPKTPEPTDDERDRRTVFVQQLAARLRTKELKTFFEQVGGVVDAQIVKDRVSGRSKG